MHCPLPGPPLSRPYPPATDLEALRPHLHTTTHHDYRLASLHHIGYLFKIKHQVRWHTYVCADVLHSVGQVTTLLA